MPINPFAQLAYADLVAKIPKRAAIGQEVQDFLNGDHIRNGDSWLGDLPKDAETRTKMLKAVVSENVLDEVLEGHIGGVLGREPRWGYIPNTIRRARRRGRMPTDAQSAANPLGEQADEAVTDWWDERKILDLLQQGATKMLAEERAPLRVFIPPGLRDENGTIPRCESVEQALRYIYVDTPSPESAGVYLDPDTRMQLSVYSYTRDQQSYVDVSYLDETGKTVLRVLSNGQDATPDEQVFDLHGRLFLYDMTRRKAFITPLMLGEQKGVMQALTQLLRNVQLAGNRQIDYFNVKPPGEWVEAQPGDPNAQDGKVFKAGTIKRGAGASNMYQTVEVINEKGEVIGYASADYLVLDPVEVTAFRETRAIFREAIYGQAQQLHRLVVGDATLSGKSRTEMRADFRTSLEMSKTPIDDAGRWLLETVLFLAAELMQVPMTYQDLRAEFGCIVDTGPLTPEEQDQIRANVLAGLTSEETGMSQIGHADVTAEKARIAADRAERQARQPATARVSENGSATGAGDEEDEEENRR